MPFVPPHSFVFAKNCLACKRTLKAIRPTVTFQLQQMQGRVLKQEKIKSFAKIARQQIDVSGLANGVYLLVIVSDKGIRHTEKIVVVH